MCRCRAHTESPVTVLSINLITILLNRLLKIVEQWVVLVHSVDPDPWILFRFYVHKDDLGTGLDAIVQPHLNALDNLLPGGGFRTDVKRLRRRGSESTALYLLDLNR